MNPLPLFPRSPPPAFLEIGLQSMTLNIVPRMSPRLTIGSILHPTLTKTPSCVLSYRRALHRTARTPALPSWSFCLRPVVPFAHSRHAQSSPIVASGIRTIFIQTENTPNADVSVASMPVPLDTNLQGLEILAESPNITWKLFITVPRILNSTINSGPPPPITACCTTSQHRWNHVGILRPRLHHCYKGR